MFGFTAELGNLLLDAITFNPPIELAEAAEYYTEVAQKILGVFPEIAAQVTKTSGKMLLHHTGTHSLTYSLTYSLSYSLTYSLIYSLTYSLTQH
jgi:hypothetical protein